MKPIRLEELEELAPAALQTQPHGRTTERYTPVSTIDILEKAVTKGYSISRAQQKATRTVEAMPYARHLISLRPAKAFSSPAVGDVSPEVIIVNGHDGFTSYYVYLGLYRFVCANGLMVGDTFDSFRIPHRGDIVDEVLEATEKQFERAGELYDWIDRAQKIKLDHKTMTSYAKDAAAIRWKDGCPFEPEALLRARRPEDEGVNAWQVFNRVQENLMGGGIEGRSATGRRTTTRPIARVTKDVMYNRELWDLTEQYLEAA